jgi:hypothetical protein
VLEDLRKGLRADDPPARAAAVRTFVHGVPLLSDEQRRLAAKALRKSFEGDADGPVRVEETRALAALHDEAAWVPVVLAALKDRDPDVFHAARVSVWRGRQDLLDVVAKLLHEDQDPTFRANVLLLLGWRRKRDAVPTCLDALADSHPRVVAAAAEALEAISGQALGLSPDAWRSWAKADAAAPSKPTPSAGGGPSVTRETPVEDEPPPLPPPSGLVPDFYGLRLASKDYVFVIDVSGSMGSAGFDTAKGEVVRAVERLGSDVRIAALFFAEEVVDWHPEMVPATPGAKADLAKFVRGVARGKRTDVMTPLNAGLQIARRRVEQKLAAKEAFVEPVTMVVVSDGLENKRETPGDVVGDKLDRLDLAHTVVHAVVVGGKDNALMRALAHRAGGRYVVVP